MKPGRAERGKKIIASKKDLAPKMEEKLFKWCEKESWAWGPGLERPPRHAAPKGGPGPAASGGGAVTQWELEQPQETRGSSLGIPRNPPRTPPDGERVLGAMAARPRARWTFTSLLPWSWWWLLRNS